MFDVIQLFSKDGYILELHRIAGGRKYPPRKGKKVCFLQHGLLDSSATWVFTHVSGPNHGLGIELTFMFCLNVDKFNVFFGWNSLNLKSI